MTTVHNLTQESLQPGDVYIGRAGQGLDGYFGNPYPLKDRTPHAREVCLRAFRHYAEQKAATDPQYAARVRELHGKRLFCFCDPQPCHGHILAELADELHEEWAAQQWEAWCDWTSCNWNGE